MKGPSDGQEIPCPGKMGPSIDIDNRAAQPLNAFCAKRFTPNSLRGRPSRLSLGVGIPERRHGCIVSFMSVEFTDNPTEEGKNEGNSIDALYRKYSEALRRFLARRHVKRDEVADIVQETYCRVLNSGELGRFATPEHFCSRWRATLRSTRPGIGEVPVNRTRSMFRVPRLSMSNRVPIGGSRLNRSWALFGLRSASSPRNAGRFSS